MKNIKKSELTREKDFSRRSFITKTTLAAIGTIGAANIISSCKDSETKKKEEKLQRKLDKKNKPPEEGAIQTPGENAGTSPVNEV